MREYVKAGEVAAVLGLDTKVTEWNIWNRMSEDDDGGDMTEHSRWQGRLASEIAAGIAQDNGIKISKSLSSQVGNGIMPPRAWEVAPNSRANGKPGVLVVSQRTQSSLYGWEAPETIPEKALMRYYATAIAYGYDYAYVGILVDGYRSELYRIEIKPDIKKMIIEKVDEMIKMVKDDDEPVVDYDRDRSAILEGKISVEAKNSGEELQKLLIERDEKLSEKTNLSNRLNAAKKRIETIEAIFIASIPENTTIDVGDKVVGVEKNSRGKLELKVANKAKDVTSLF